MLKYFVSSVLLLAFLFTGCSQKDEKTAFNDAKAKLQSRDIAGAVTDFETFIKDFPKSETVPEVLMELGGIFQSQLDTRLTGEASVRKAVEYYSQVTIKHPQSKEAAKAQFLVAYLQSNELKEYDAARASYEKFIANYPNDPMIQSAKDEIANIGVPPEEIIRRKSASAQK